MSVFTYVILMYVTSDLLSFSLSSWILFLCSSCCFMWSAVTVASFAFSCCTHVVRSAIQRRQQWICIRVPYKGEEWDSLKITTIGRDYIYITVESVLKYLQNSINIYKTLAGAPMCACTLCTHLHAHHPKGNYVSYIFYMGTLRNRKYHGHINN